jgi:hypothetical protein
MPGNFLLPGFLILQKVVIKSLVLRRMHGRLFANSGSIRRSQAGRKLAIKIATVCVPANKENTAPETLSRR